MSATHSLAAHCLAALCLTSAALSACGPAPVASSSASQHPSRLPSQPPSAQPGSPPRATPSMAPRPAPTLPPRQSTGGSSVAISGLRFEAANRFLNAKGETVRLYLTLLGPQGQPLSPEVQAALPIEWLSTRPQDLSVDAQGFVKALVEEGFSTIIARVPGSTYEAQTLFSVSSGRSGGGGGGGGGSSGGGVSAALNPVIQSLSVSQTQVLGAGAVVRLDAQASYNGSGLGNGDYRWSCIPADCGSFSPASGPTVYWQAPAQSGSYTLQLTASNGSQSASQSLTVSVSVGTETIQVNS